MIDDIFKCYLNGSYYRGAVGALLVYGNIYYKKSIMIFNLQQT